MKKLTKGAKKALVILIVAFIAFNSSIGLYSSAIEPQNEIMPYYVNILNKHAIINISGIKSECSAELRVNNSTTLSIKMELQKSKSGGYETVETWTSSKTGTYLKMSESRLINVLSDYRLKVTFTAGSETIIAYAY